MNALTLPTLPLADIDLPPEATRRRRDPKAQALLIASMQCLGRLLQPILVTTAGNRHVVIDGAGRVLAARQLGWLSLPVHIVEDLSDRDAAVAAVAANTVRAPLSLPEQWRAVSGLVDQGWPADQAALAIGLTERQARQCDRLGRLHPDVMAQLDRVIWDSSDDDGLYPPDEDDLAAIARLAPEQQAELLKATLASAEGMSWRQLAVKARQVGKSASRAHALFDADDAGIAWQQDVFAEPGSAAEWTTTDIQGFVAAQVAAISTKVDRRPQEHLAAWDERNHAPALPADFRAEKYGNDAWPQLAKTDPRFAFIAVNPDTGRAAWRLGLIANKAAPRAPLPAAAAPIDNEPDDNGDDAVDEPSPAVSPAMQAARRPLTAQGDLLLAQARTAAIRTALRQPDLPISPDDLVALLVIGLTTQTVTVRNGHEFSASRTSFTDLAAKLVGPDGKLSPHVDPYQIAAEALARIITLPAVGADKPAEWIGGAIGALEHLPRLDTEPFLATVAGDVLKARAAELGLKLKKVGEIRSHLTGKDPEWKPAFAHFGAPGPMLAPISTAEDHDDD